MTRKILTSRKELVNFVSYGNGKRNAGNEMIGHSRVMHLVHVSKMMYSPVPLPTPATEMGSATWEMRSSNVSGLFISCL